MIQNGMYEHYKGGMCEVIGVAKYSETLEEMVVYKHTDSLGEEGWWVRPASMFLENVTIDGVTKPRFRRVSHMLHFGKLVRDKIPEMITSRKERAVWHIADDAEYDKLLREKLKEESREVLEAMSIEECADVCEVLDAIAVKGGKTFDDVLRAKNEKAEKRGGFAGRIVLDEADEKRG